MHEMSVWHECIQISIIDRLFRGVFFHVFSFMRDFLNIWCGVQMGCDATHLKTLERLKHGLYWHTLRTCMTCNTHSWDQSHSCFQKCASEAQDWNFQDAKSSKPNQYINLLWKARKHMGPEWCSKMFTWKLQKFNNANCWWMTRDLEIWWSENDWPCSKKWSSGRFRKTIALQKASLWASKTAARLSWSLIKTNQIHTPTSHWSKSKASSRQPST